MNFDYSLLMPVAISLIIGLLTLCTLTLVFGFQKVLDTMLLRYEPLNVPTELSVAWHGWRFYTDVTLERMRAFLLKADPKVDSFWFMKQILYPFFYILCCLLKSSKSPNSIELFEQQVGRIPDHVALVFTKTGQQWTFKQLDAEINKMANILLDSGVKQNSTVSLFLENEPVFIISWLACLKIGASAAFINPKLTGDSLTHVLKVSESSKVVCRLDKVLLKSVQSLTEASQKWQVLYFNSEQDDSLRSEFAKNNFQKVDLDAKEANTIQPDVTHRSTIKYTDTAMLIYTSGTTGLPKPAIISHARFLMGQVGFAGFTRLSESDRLYSCLPLYHGSAAMGAFGSCMATGSTFILSPKFSARNFFKECKANNATVVQYIGELGRFLLSTECSSADKDHNVRLAFGNGMRKDIWLQFKKRFNIPILCEFYGSTEGTATLVNYQFNDKYGVGACGRVGLFQQIFAPLAVIKIDTITQEVHRNPNGTCISADRNTPGELMGMVKKGDPISDFKGYKSNAKQTNSKLLSQVFSKSDVWFRSGDIVLRDSNDYLYFVDRLGDTFRWKGENVATTEVGNILSKFPGADQVMVYGVEVPKNDGRAGMAAIQRVQQVEMADLAKHLIKSLPKYAVPLFIRFMKELPVTPTMKHQKFVLVQQGFDPSVVGDDIYILQKDTYVRFTSSMYQDLKSGSLRV